MMKDNDVIVAIFSNEQVRRCKVAHFHKQFDRNALPQGPALAELMNRFRFLVHPKSATGTRLTHHLLHEAGFKTDGNPIHLAGDFVVAVHQADGL